MSSFGYSELLTRFAVVPRNTLKFISPEEDIDGLFSVESQQPENLGEYLWDPNDFYIEPKNDKKKPKEEQKQILLIGQSEEKKEGEQKKKNYKPGPFALFYQLNQGELNKDAKVWYYKQKKDVVGPVSSYNMDKMVFYHEINDDTRVAFKTVQKFVKFSKIKKILEEQKEKEAKEE